MYTILTWLIITGGLFFIFLLLLFLGIWKKKMGFIYASLLIFFLTGLSGLWMAYVFVSKSYRTVKEAVRPRTGIDIYNAMFDKSPHNCVTVLNYQDQHIPRLDCCIWLEFTTCPAELKRIIAQQPYQPIDSLYGDTAFYIPSYSPLPGWWKQNALGDNIIQLIHPESSNREFILLFAADSTHALYCDMAD